jgi:hypothetical protein
MWAELGFEDHGQPRHPPPLAHERWAEAHEGWHEVCQTAAERVRASPGFDDKSSTVTAEDLDGDLGVTRLLKRLDGDTRGVTEKLVWSTGFELHRRKTFWVDEALTYMLARTDFNVVGSQLRLPFPSFAFVFTDRHVLSLAERHLATEPECPLAGQILRVATVFVTEVETEAERLVRIGFALDALGADEPYLHVHEIRFTDDEPIDLGLPAEPTEEITDGEWSVPTARPMPGLLEVVLNAILYATSSSVEPQARETPRGRRGRGSDGSRLYSAEEVFFLPGKIKITSVRELQELDRVRSGRQLLHRFMVRGHWRRPAKTWKDQRMRWIEPYWKGPDLATVIERTYELAP